jgi:hypothetical protein
METWWYLSIPCGLNMICLKVKRIKIRRKSDADADEENTAEDLTSRAGS